MWRLKWDDERRMLGPVPETLQAGSQCHYHFIVVRDNLKLGVIVHLLNDRDSLLEDLGRQEE